MSTDSAPASASTPADPGGQLAAALLDRLDGGADVPLAALARAYARRASVAGLDEAGLDRLAAQVSSLFRFISARRPRRAGRPRVQPQPRPDGW